MVLPTHTRARHTSLWWHPCPGRPRTSADVDGLAEAYTRARRPSLRHPRTSADVDRLAKPAGAVLLRKVRLEHAPEAALRNGSGVGRCFARVEGFGWGRPSRGPRVLGISRVSTHLKAPVQPLLCKGASVAVAPAPHARTHPFALCKPPCPPGSPSALAGAPHTWPHVTSCQASNVLGSL